MAAEEILYEDKEILSQIQLCFGLWLAINNNDFTVLFQGDLDPNCFISLNLNFHIYKMRGCANSPQISLPVPHSFAKKPHNLGLFNSPNNPLR